MKAVYNCCIPDPWLDVAKFLLKEKSVEPVYWIGWSDYDFRFNLPQDINFNNCTFHDINDAWKGIFPKEISNIPSISLDGEIIDRISSSELLAIKMMDRLDPDRRSFTFEERQRHFRRLLSQWLGIIDNLEVELFISPSIPHRVFDFAFYIGCQLRGVKTILYKMTPFQDVLIPISDVFSLPGYIKEDYNNLKNKFIEQYLPDEILYSIEGSEENCRKVFFLFPF